MEEVVVEVEHALHHKNQLHLTTTIVHDYHSSPIRRQAGFARRMVGISQICCIWSRPSLHRQIFATNFQTEWHLRISHASIQPRKQP